MNKTLKDDGMQSEILSDRLTNEERRKYLNGDEMERIEDNQENQGEENYKNSKYFLYYVITVLVRNFQSF